MALRRHRLIALSALAFALSPDNLFAQGTSRGRQNCADFFAHQTHQSSPRSTTTGPYRPLIETPSAYEQGTLDLFLAIQSLGETTVKAMVGTGRSRGRTSATATHAVETVIRAYREAHPIVERLRQNSALERESQDPELAPLIESERQELRAQLHASLQQSRGPLANVLTPTGDVAILEIGRSLGNFSSGDLTDLVSMYSRYATSKRWQVSVLEETFVNNELRRMVLKIEGPGAYQALHLDRGDHRFIRYARVGSTRAQGLRFTNHARVAVYRPPLPSEFQLNFDDLEITTMRSSGAGGQHVNRTESAVRIVHRPTGLSVRVENERSQHQNRATAVELITAQLFTRFQAERAAAERAERQQGRANSLVTGDQARWTRTYDWTMNSETADRAIRGDLDHLLAPRLEAALVNGLNRFTQGLEHGSIDLP